MQKDDVIKLYTINRTQDAYGRWMEGNPTVKEVFARVKSISRSEFFDAGRQGLNPDLRFDIFTGDYNGETIIEYNGKTYAVYRTYENGDYMELYVERKGGADGKQYTPQPTGGNNNGNS